MRFFFFFKKEILVICFLTERKSVSLNPMKNFLTQFFLGSISNKFDTVGSREVSLKECMVFNSITVLLINLIY